MSVRPRDGLDPAEADVMLAAEQAACHRPDAPAGYLAWWDWAERMSKTHTQRRCAAHGLWHEWVPREPADATPDDRQDETDVPG
jgi:hypothetical protein